MTRAQKESLRDAIIADLAGLPVEWRYILTGQWVACTRSPNFEPVCNGECVEWRPKPPEPQPLLKRWAVITDLQCDSAYTTKEHAERNAKQLKGTVVELTETSRVSFADKPREPLRIVSVIAPDGHLSGFSWDHAKAGLAREWANRNGGRVAEFVEVVK